MNARKLKLNTVAVKLGCSSCRKKFKLSDIFSPKQKTPSSSYRKLSKESAVERTMDDKEMRLGGGFGRVMDGSVAVEKVSEDPYVEFRRSMLEMIVENGMCLKEDLQELLECFLLLNSEAHHEAIFRAFADVWSLAFCSGSDLMRREDWDTYKL